MENVYGLNDFNAFLSAETDQRYRCLWLTLYFCGLRIGEARGLQWNDIDWDNRTLYVRKQVQSLENNTGTWFMCDLKTKTSYRKLPMCDKLYNELKSYHSEVSKFKNYSDTFFVFGKDSGINPLSHSQPQRRKKLIAETANVKEIRLHDFRHSCASLLINSGRPITTVSKYMGHASVTETLNTYSHMFKNDFDCVTNIFNELNK